MTTWKYPIELYDKQRQAVAAPADEVLFGGSLGGGKTEMILKHMVDICCLVPNAKTLVIRRSFPELIEIAGRLKKRIPPQLATYNKSDHVLRFHHNGAELHLGYLDSEDDATRYQGQEYVKVGFDELTHYDKEWVALVTSRIRGTGQIAEDMTRHGFTMGVLAASNPGGRGHAWTKETFIDPAPAGEPFTGEDGVRRVFIPSSLYDNPFIDHEDYVRRLGALDPERKRALIEGDWSIPAGTRFPQFRERIHVIKPEDFPIPPVGVVRVVGVDYGINDPFAAVWAAKVGDTIVVYRDHVQDGLAASQQAAKVLELESEEERLHSDVTVALDPNGWARNPHFGGKKLSPGADEAPLGSIAYAFREALGDRVVKGWNPRVQGWAIFDELMVERDTGTLDEDGNPVKLPRILIYDTCRELIRFMSSAPRAKRDPQDVDCFVAGTMIATPEGERPIEDIRVGDYVDTPMGPQRVLRAGAEGVVPVVSVSVTGGRVLTGTPDHEVVTVNGLVPMSCLGDNEVITQTHVERLGTWTPATQSFTAKSHTAGRQAGPTTFRTTRSTKGNVNPSTATSTETTTGTSPLDTMCTTSTMTPRITALKTSFSSRLVTMRATIMRSAPKTLWRLVESGASRRSGLRRRLAVGLRLALTQRARTERARIVEALSVTRTPVSDTAHRNAGKRTRLHELRRGAESSTPTPAPFVGEITSPLRLGRAGQLHVPMNAGGSTGGNQTVYALTVDGCALYYANGALVTNTTWKHDHVGDGARYCISELLGLSYNRPLNGHERLRLEGTNRSVTAGAQTVSF